MRDLIRLRSVMRQVVTRARQHLQGFLLRHGRKHERGTAWRKAYRRWLSTLAFDHPAQQIVFQDYVDAVMDAERRLQQVEEQILSLLPEWNQRPVVDALQAMRGIALINAVVLVAEVGDFTRFSNHASSWPISAWSPENNRVARPSGAAASPRPATLMPGARWSKAPGLTG
ncbi:transposase [Mesorhizobium australicum]|uniref:transposase n=1 Tax=Mesorhizobium australicum TaxID=536018 RepID=UPI003336FB0F